VGRCIWYALLGAAELTPFARADGADGCADTLSAGILCGDVLDAVPEIWRLKAAALPEAAP
jgi:hypothetical protein